MASQDDAKKRIRRRLGLDVQTGRLGDEAGIVFDNPKLGMVRVKLDAPNDTGVVGVFDLLPDYIGPDTAGTPVVIGYNLQGQIGVLKPNTRAQKAQGVSPVVNNPASSQVYKYKSTGDLLLFRSQPVKNTLKVSVMDGQLLYMDDIIHWKGGNINLSSFVPAAGTHRVVNIYLEPSTVTLNAFASAAQNVLIPLDFTDVNEAHDSAIASSYTQMPIWSWKLVGGQTTIKNSDSFLDLRQWLNYAAPKIVYTAPASTLTLATDAITITQGWHIVAAETGTADNLSTITVGSLGFTVGTRGLFVTLQADSGDTITVKHNVGNILLNSEADFALSGDKTLLLFYDGTNWSDVSAGGGSSDTLHSLHTVNPTTADNTAAGYADGHIWTNIDNSVTISGKSQWVKLSESAGSAVWLKTTKIYGFGTAPGPTTDDTQGYFVGDIIAAPADGNAYICIDNTTNSAIWRKIDQTRPYIIDGSLPTVNDDVTLGYLAGQIWVASLIPQRVFICKDNTDGAAVWLEIVGMDAMQTLTNKTIDGDTNTIQDLNAGTVLKSGTAVPIANGGTGQTTQTTAFDALSPTTTKGDLIVYNGTDNIRVAVGNYGQTPYANAAAASGIDYRLFTPGITGRNWGQLGPIYGSGLQGVGIGRTDSGTVTDSPQTSTRFQNFASAATTSSAAGCRSSVFTVAQRRWSPDFRVRFRTGASGDLLNIRIYIGLFSAAPGSTDTPSGHFAGVRYSTVAGDSGFMMVTRDGTTQTVGSQVSTIAASTEYDWLMRLNSTDFTITTAPGSSVTTSTTLPGTTTELGILCFIYTTENVAKNILISRMYAEWD